MVHTTPVGEPGYNYARAPLCLADGCYVVGPAVASEAGWTSTGVADRATNGCFHCHLPPLSGGRDQRGLKNDASTLFERDLEER